MFYSSRIFLGTLGFLSISGVSTASYFLLNSSKQNQLEKKLAPLVESKSIPQSESYRWEFEVWKDGRGEKFCGKRENGKVVRDYSCFTADEQRANYSQGEGMQIRIKNNSSSSATENKNTLEKWSKNFQSDGKNCTLTDKQDGWIELKCTKNK